MTSDNAQLTEKNPHSYTEAIQHGTTFDVLRLHETIPGQKGFSSKCAVMEEHEKRLNIFHHSDFP
jgi:hypothetical protein